MAVPLRLRVFLASPGDVSDERALARQVLERLPYDPFVRGRLEIEIVAWDQPGGGTPMLATMTPQAAIAEGRLLWVWLSRVWCHWRAALVIVKPDTVIAWHRRGFRLFGTRAAIGRVGRPSLTRYAR